MSLSYTWWKKSVYNNFRAFFIIFDQANACASMCSLVEIHNTYHVTWFWECPLKEKNKISLICFVYLNSNKTCTQFQSRAFVIICVYLCVHILCLASHGLHVDLLILELDFGDNLPPDQVEEDLMDKWSADSEALVQSSLVLVLSRPVMILSWSVLIQSMSLMS